MPSTSPIHGERAGSAGCPWRSSWRPIWPRRSPIALSAFQELAGDSSPCDVSYGKFLGGNVNIVTKSGTNEFKGTLLGT